MDEKAVPKMSCRKYTDPDGTVVYVDVVTGRVMLLVSEEEIQGKSFARITPVGTQNVFSDMSAAQSYLELNELELAE